MMPLAYSPRRESIFCTRRLINASQSTCEEWATPIRRRKSNFLTRIEQDRLSTAQLDPEYGKAEGNNCESEHDLADCVRFWSLRLALAFAMGLQSRAAASASCSCPTGATAISVCAK